MYGIMALTVKKGGGEMRLKERTIQMSFKVPEKLAAEFRDVCEMNGIKQSFVIKKAFERFLEEKNSTAVPSYKVC
jgi:hypothetical protein